MKTFACILVAILSVFQFATCAEADDEVDREFVRSATRVLLENHIRKHIDRRQLSNVWARQFMLNLDPRHMHFLVSDVNEFAKLSSELLDDAEKGKFEFPLLVVQRFRERLHANSSLISDLFDAKHDFAIDEYVQIEHGEYAADKVDSDDRWRLRIKYELLLENPKLPVSKDSRRFLQARYSRIHTHFDSLSQSKILSLYIDALAKSVEPDGAHFDEEFLRQFRTSIIPNFTIGLQLDYRKGDLWILPSNHDREAYGQSLAGYGIVAVRRDGKEPIHLSGLTDGTAYCTLISNSGELGVADTVILELDDPNRGKRMSVACDRWLNR